MWSCYSFQLSSRFSPKRLKGLNMRIQGRLRIWVLISGLYLVFMALVHVLHIPLRSKTVHSHYDLSGEAVHQSHHNYIRREADKIARAALRFHKPVVSIEEQTKILRDVFSKADENKDDTLEIDEIAGWIGMKVKDHLTLALRENFFMFTAIDQDPRNGIVSWDEYYKYFLKQHGYDDQFIQDHKESTKGMTREVKEAIMRDKAQWSEAARDNPDSLSIDEFLAFRHPESSHASILTIVEEMISRLDIDEDGKISIEEFSDPATNDVPDYLTDDQFRSERRQEFMSYVDADRNGKVNKMELLTYVDPRSFHHSEKEAVNLVSAADTNRDGVLSVEEVLASADIFMASKMVNVAKSFHDEF